MKTLKYIILIIALIGITACRKKHTVTLQAQNLTNVSDGSHYAGMKYIIVERRVGAFENKYKTVKEGLLDDNGYANFDLRMHFNRTYDLGIQKPDNICYTEVGIKYPLKDGQNNNITFNYAPCGWVKIYTNNINCEGSTDKLQYIYTYEKGYDIYIEVLVTKMVGMTMLAQRVVKTYLVLWKKSLLAPIPLSGVLSAPVAPPLA